MFVLPSRQPHHSLSVTSCVLTVDSIECVSDKYSEYLRYFFLLPLVERVLLGKMLNHMDICFKQLLGVQS